MLMNTILGPEFEIHSDAIKSFKDMPLSVLNDVEIFSFDF